MVTIGYTISFHSEAEPGDGPGVGEMGPMGRRRLLGAAGASRVPLDEGVAAPAPAGA